MTIRPCSVCGDSRPGTVFNGPVRDGAFGSLIAATVSRCAACGVERLEDIQLPKDYYASDAYRNNLNERPDVEGYFELHDGEQYSRLGLLERVKFRGAVVVDVGCAGGSFLDSVKGFAKATVGIDPATSYRPSMRERGHTVFGSVEEALPEWNGKADVATCFSVIEHVEDPVGLLRGMRSLLGPSGVAVISTPNRSDILMSEGGEAYRAFFYRKVHNFYFDGASLIRTAAIAGFDRTELRFVHRFGHANYSNWLRDKRPSGDTPSPLGPQFDQSWRGTLEDRGLADYLYAFLHT